MFFRLCTELCVEQYESNGNSAAGDMLISSVAKLIVYVVKYQVDPKYTKVDLARVTLFMEILSVIVLVIVNAHEHAKQSFNQQPYFKLLLSLLNELRLQEQQMHSIYFQLLSSVS